MNTARIHIQLFGELTVSFEDNTAPPVNRFSTQKTAALLALLAMSPGKSFSREVLIDRLWGDAPLEDGRRSLRVALAALRRILEPTGTPTGTVLSATRESVSINADTVTTDVQAFDRAVRQGDCETARQLFATGELLAAFYDDWVLREREHLSDAHEKLSERGRVAVAEPLPPTLSPPKPAPRDPRERLPHYLTRYMGRETERETFAALLDDTSHRLVTVTGTGGVGKTRFVTEVMDGLSGAKSLRYISLSDTTDAAGFLQRVGVALGLEPANATASAVAFALHSLGESLLVLDNMEQLLPTAAGDTVATWLAECPQLQVVATSRERLHIFGEVELPLEPLLVPTLPATPERLLDFAAVRLFLDRARLARPDAVMTPRNAETVSALCERLGGLPLALEITASWAGALTFAQMLSRIRSHLLDETGAPAAHRRAARPERHRTLRAALDTSLELLSPGLREAFVALSVFRGSFTVDAAIAVLGSENGSPETLTRLRERSLLATDSDPDAETLRFRLLPAVWEYARECFEQRPEGVVLARAHSAYYLQLAETPRSDEKSFDVEYANLLAAMDSCDTNTKTLRFCVALQPFWEARGHHRAGKERTERALEKATDDVSPTLLRQARHCAGKLAYHLCDYASSRAHHEVALHLAERLYDAEGRGKALQGIAACLLYENTDLPGVMALCEASREAFRAAGSVGGESGILIAQSTVLMMMGDKAGALTLCRDALALALRTGDAFVEARARHYLGGVLTPNLLLDEAEAQFNRAIELYRAIGDRHAVAACLQETATLRYERSEYDDALRLYEEAVAVFRASGEWWAVAVSSSNLGRLCTETGAFARAASHLSESLAIRVRLGDKHAQLQSTDAVVNLLVGLATQTGKPFGRAFAREAVRLRAAENTHRAALGLGQANPDDALRTREETFATRLGASAFAAARAEGATLSLADTVAALRAALAKIR